MNNEIPLWKRLVKVLATALIMFVVGYLIFVGVNYKC